MCNDTIILHTTLLSKRVKRLQVSCIVLLFIFGNVIGCLVKLFLINKHTSSLIFFKSQNTDV